MNQPVIIDEKDAILRLNAILNAIPDIVVDVDVNKVYTWANSHAYEFFGDDLIGKEAKEYFIGEQITYDIVQPLYQGSEETIYVESWQRRKDGQKRLLAWWCHTLKDKDGTVIGTVSTARDITDQKNTEESLSKSHLILQNIIDLLPVRIFWKDTELRYLGCNKAFAQDAGKQTTEELIGKNDFDMAWKDQADLYRADDTNVISSGKAKINYEEPQTTKDGDTLWLHTNKVPLIDASQKIIGVVGTYLDITDRKKTEHMVHTSEERLKKAQSLAHVGNWELTIQTKTIWASEEAFRIYGIERKSEVLPLTLVQNLVLPQYRTLLDNALENLIAHNVAYNVEFEIKRDDGTVRFIHSKAELVTDQNGTPILVMGAIQDITDRKTVENEMRTKNTELEKMNASMVNRELRMVELKEKIKELEAKLQHVTS